MNSEEQHEKIDGQKIKTLHTKNAFIYFLIKN